MLSIHVWFCHRKMDLFVRLYKEKPQEISISYCSVQLSCWLYFTYSWCVIELPFSKVKSLPLLVLYHCIVITFSVSPLKCARYLKNPTILALATCGSNEYIFNTGQFFSPKFGFVLLKFMSWSQTNFLVILNITFSPPCSSGMFEDSTYLYLIEPMDLTHTAVSLFLPDFFGLGECSIPTKSIRINQWVICLMHWYENEMYFRTLDLNLFKVANLSLWFSYDFSLLFFNLLFPTCFWSFRWWEKPNKIVSHSTWLWTVKKYFSICSSIWTKVFINSLNLSLNTDTVKETGSTFRGLCIIWTVNYWSINETSEAWANTTSKRISLPRNNSTCCVSVM